MSEPLAPGARVGRYTLAERLGSGAAGVVFSAVSDGGAPVALKVLRPDAAEDREAVARMEREAAILRALDHPGIVAAREVGRLEDGRPWIAMERLDGRSLRELCTEGALRGDGPGAWRLLRPVCDALAAAHAGGVIHRDIKPENLLLDHRGRARVVDFGLARSVEPGGSSLTGPGVAVGTPPYMSPELWWSAALSPAVDQYAFACTLYELLVGRTPFVADSFAGWMEGHLHGAVPSVGDAVRDAATRVRVDRFFQRALAKDVASRFASMTDLRAEADEVLGRAESPDASRMRGAAWVALWVALGPVGLLVSGHGGVHRPAELLRLAGVIGVLPLGFGLLAGAMALRGATPWALAACTVATGVLCASAGWGATLSHVANAAPEQRFALLHQGLLEADVNRAIGYWLAWSALCAGLAIGPRRDGRAPGLARWACFALLGWTARCLGVHVSLAAALCLAPLGLFLSRDTRARTEWLAAASCALAAMACAWGAVSTRIAAQEAAVWRDALERASRVSALSSLARESLGSTAVCVSSCAALLVSCALGARRARASASANPRRAAAAAGVALALVALEAAQRGRVRDARDGARAVLAPQFELFSRLELPRARGLGIPSLAPSVQLAQDVVAIDGRSVLRVEALDTERGRSALAADLAHRFARERGGLARWTLAVDRRTPWRRVRALWALAREVGGGQVELLFARGEAPRWTRWAPPESATMLPQDYAAFALSSRDDPRVWRVAEEASFESVLPGLCGRSTEGEGRLGAPREERPDGRTPSGVADGPARGGASEAADTRIEPDRGR